MWFKKRKVRPTAEEAARRLVVLKYVVVSGLMAPPREMLAVMMGQWSDDERRDFVRKGETTRDSYWQPLREAGLWSHLTPIEQAHAKTTMETMSQQQQIDASWRLESAQVLAWALGRVWPLPPYDTMANSEILKTIATTGIAAFIKTAKLRSQTEIDEARDLAEFWHWRSRTRELIERGEVLQTNPGMEAAGFRTFDDVIRASAEHGAQKGTIPPSLGGDFPARGKSYRDLSAEEWTEVRSITTERHHALNWLCGYAPKNQWDETPTDT